MENTIFTIFSIVDDYDEILGLMMKENFQLLWNFLNNDYYYFLVFSLSGFFFSIVINIIIFCFPFSLYSYYSTEKIDKSIFLFQ